MAESQSDETTHEIEAVAKDVLDKIINYIDYELMEEKLRRLYDIDEEQTIGNLAGLLFYVTQYAGGDHCAYDITRPDDNSKAGPVETIRDDDVVVVSPAAREAVEERSDVTPARGLEVRNTFGDLIGWLDPGVTLEICEAPRRRTPRIVSAAWRGITKAVRVFCSCCSLK